MSYIPVRHPLDHRPRPTRTRRALQEASGRVAGWLLVSVLGVDTVFGR